MKDIQSFLEKISGFDHLDGGFVEIVIDYTTSKYFGNDEVEAAVKYASEMAQSGHEVHFGPAVRKEDLGSKRSDRKNVLWIKCLWIDIDSPDKTLSADEKLRAAEKLKNNFIESLLKGYGLEPSYIICSAHGYHIYFVFKRVHMEPSEWSKIQNAIISMAKGDQQAKDAGRLLRVPGTLNWKDKSNPREVKIIHDSGCVYDEKDFIQLVKDYTRNITPVSAPTGAKPLGFIPPCIGHLLDPKTSVELGHRHSVRLTVSTFGFHEGWPVESTIEKLKHITDDEKKSEDDIHGVYKTLQKDPEHYKVGCGAGSNLKALVDSGITTCDKANCNFGKPLVKDTQAPAADLDITKSADFPQLVDLVMDDQGKIAFLVKDGISLILKYEYQDNGKKLIPPPKDKVRWLLPKGSAVQQHFVSDSDTAIFNDLINYFKTISDMPDENHYYFIAAYVMHTYRIDKFEYSPTLWFYAIPERGKTRTGKAMTYTAYRGVHIITLREAHIIRLAKDLRATLFIDVSDLQQKIDTNNVDDVLLNRYERGAQIARVLYPDKGPFDDTVYYDIYGATMVATNETVNDILATRTIQIIMPEAHRQFTDDVKPLHGLPFRERLLGFRARWMEKDLPDADKPCLGRLGDILRPIRQIVKIVSPDESWFLTFVTGVEQKRKLSGADGLDAQVVHAIKESMCTLKKGHILHDDILRKVNVSKSENEKITPQKLGKITARLGFEKYTSGQQRGIYWNQDLFSRLCERYGIDAVAIFPVETDRLIDQVF
ncbi:MAG: hypothetical protein WCQ90_02410 [Deltaproteobacteria bacterium]